MTLGTRLLTWLRGELVGTDSDGNRYYRECGEKPLGHFHPTPAVLALPDWRPGPH
jgi:hypothetical protein